MLIARGVVIGGRVIVEGPPLKEGSTVTVLVSEERTYTLDPNDETTLLEAIAEADRGDLVDGDDVVNGIA